MNPVAASSAEFPAGPHHTLARLSFGFLLDEITTGLAALEPLDALLVLAINQANIVPLTRDADARARYGQLDAPAPDDERCPVSINAVAGSLGLPFETTRRRIRRLAGGGTCIVSPEGVVVPASFLASPAYFASVLAGHERLHRFYLDLRTAGLVEEMPPPAYGLEGRVPVRAAARLLADYMLRMSDGLMREAGSVVSALLLAALLDAALQAPEAAPRSMSALRARLRLPGETVRRHVARLADDGLVTRTTAGAVLLPESFARPGLQRLFDDNAANVQRLLAGLAERGVILAWETGGSMEGRASA
ncbi:hypothetical protein [uncultured Phenylobacterium sp.]|uniref:hypothetical protein n=1 Tax=uncultured Phenylobacterium sp. TaxID=349273 RepID=UPI0025DCFC35|nr:hypothetical protein [uncultured Phenylobacterium sp.]